MKSLIVLRRTLLTASTIRCVSPSLLNYTSTTSHRYISTPVIANTSFWASLVPKPLRKGHRDAGKSKPTPTEWNPATFFIIAFLLVGSNSIQMIAVKKDFTAFSRRADAKIGLLKEIIERVQNGEDVDVEGLLGTGQAEMEKEWEEVLQEIEKEEGAWELSRKPKPKHGRNIDDSKVSPVIQDTKVPEDMSKGEIQPNAKQISSGRPRFY